MNLKLALTIFNWLTSLPVSKYDAAEDYGARSDRLWVIAEAVADSSGGDRRVAAFELAQAKSETDFALDAQTCQCKPGRCDPVHGIATAHSLWQHHRAPTQSVASWNAYCGTSYSAVKAGADRTRVFLRSTGGDLPKAFARMGGARSSIESQWVKRRVKATLELERKL